MSKYLIFSIDLAVVLFSYTLTYYICFNLINAPVLLQSFLIKLGLCIFVHGICFIVFGTSLIVLRHSSFHDVFRILIAVCCANLLLFIINAILDNYYNRFIFPNIGFLINLALIFGLTVVLRMCVKLCFGIAKSYYSKRKIFTPLLIYGANNSNVNLAELINSSESLAFKVVGFIVPSKSNAKNKTVAGLPVYSRDEIFDNMESQNFYKAIMIHPTEINWAEKQIFTNKCIQCKIDLFSTTTWNEWNRNREDIRRLNKVKIEDLLERPPIHIDIESIARNLEGKTVLVTGAAGSIGSEIIRQISNFRLKMVIMLDIAESPLHQLYIEIMEKSPDFSYIPVICNTQHYDRLKRVFEEYRPDYVYHAAAYKHVPLMESHPCESTLTNVLGSRNAVDLAVDYGVEAFVMISTDKAVNPTSVMGATKRIAEIYIRSLSKKLNESGNSQKNTRLIITRFGNVLGSNGSVIPLFENQIQKGGPVTVTHPDIIRYFMTIPEACRLVLEAGNFGKGGEVFVFDMGDLVKIKNLAEKMIRLSGLEPYKDIDITFTGLRPGEKLYEELLYDKEAMQPTNNPKIMKSEVRDYDYQYVYALLSDLIATAKTYERMETVRIMKKLVPEYISQNSIYSQLDSPAQQNDPTEDESSADT
ncbi:MAG: polysaccharide biosynthesis protein [Tannerella sp.]|nr:polysaccharide biosynthesis protein [Tannerella sp.]